MWRNKCLAILIGMALSALLPANIQAQSGPAKGTPDRPWAVWKVGKDSAKIVANFAAERDAVAQASKWNAANPQPERFAYLTRRESSGGEVPSLQERRGQGQIGKFKVNVEFRAGEIAYSGELKGKAQWSQTDAGSVCIESARSAYFGLIDGDRVAGVWFVKDKSQPLTTWQFKLEPAPAAKAKTKTDGAVEAIAQGDVKAFSSEKGKAVIGVLPKDDDDGKIVTAVPGQDRVWDGKTLGGFKDLLDGKKVDDATALDRMGAFIREQDPQKNEALKESANDLRAKLLDLGEDPKDIEPKVAQKVRDQIRDYVDNAGPAQRQEWFDSYADRGAPLTQIFPVSELPQVQWYQIPANKDVRQIVKNYTPPPPAPATPAGPATDPPTPAVKPPARDTDLAGKIGKITIGYLPDYDHNGKFIGNTGKLTLPDKSNPSGSGKLVIDENTPKNPGGTSTPPTGSKTTTPPAGGTSTPPSGGTTTSKTTTPPAGGTSTPPSGGTTTSKSSTPPAGGSTPPPPTRTVNNIAQTLQQQAKIPSYSPPSSSSLPSPQYQPVQRPAEPSREPIYSPTPRQRNVVTKPGGVIITACAELDGLVPADVASAAYDPAKGVLTLTLRSGGSVSCKLDPDDFVVAVRCVFETDVDPSLSMSYDRTKPGYLNVDYCGPLFKTRFGKIMYDSDDVLGSIIFNRDGDHRAAATAVIPNYEDLVCEASTTMATGSRVFLRASGARFVVRKGQIACRDIQAKVDVEATGYSADYFHDAIHRLARAMSDRFGDLTEQFDEFKSFRRLVQSVALAKWLKRHAIAFDWQPLKTYTVTAVDIPAQVPRSAWYSLFNGRNLDGWRLNTTTQELEWSIVDGALRLRPTGAKPVEMLVQSYGKNLELRFTVVTEGPVDFIIRKGTGDEGALVSIDTKGRPQKIELFLIDGAWTAIAPGFGRQGKLTYPKAPDDKDLLPPPNLAGVRVPQGSKLALYAAARRR